jgi:hypothetical protein
MRKRIASGKNVEINTRYRKAHLEEIKKQDHQRYLTHRNEVRARSKKYCEDNPEKVAATLAEYYKAHQAKIKDRSLQWRHNNPERAYENHRRWKRNNLARCNELNRKWKKAHPETSHAYCARRRTRVAANMDAFDIELSKAYRKAIANDPCFYCGDLGEQDDHYNPLAKGGTDHWWNLVRACISCNYHKHDMHGDDFLSLLRGN